MTLKEKDLIEQLAYRQLVNEKLIQIANLKHLIWVEVNLKNYNELPHIPDLLDFLDKLEQSD